MREARFEDRVLRIAIDKLVAHPDNPNRMSKTNFAKLLRNIDRTGRYEPLVVRPAPESPGTGTFFLPDGQPVERSEDFGAGFFQIINGHHRWQALKKLGYKTCDAIVWDIDDQQTDILLATLNRLGGSDVLEKKLALLKRLNARMQADQLAKLLPQTTKQIARLASLASGRSLLIAPAPSDGKRAAPFANPLVFFVNDKQQEIIENALSLARARCIGKNKETKAAKNAAALTYIAQHILMQESSCLSGTLVMGLEPAMQPLKS